MISAYSTDAKLKVRACLYSSNELFSKAIVAIHRAQQRSTNPQRNL
jgi:hypothetical protein